MNNASSFGSVIILNGPSSVGKTTLTRLLQQTMPVEALRVAIDELIEMMPEHTNQWRKPFPPEATSEQMPCGFCFQEVTCPHGELELRLHVGPFAQQIVDSLGPLALTLVRRGLHVILDTVLIQPHQLAELIEIFSPHIPVLSVGLSARLSTLEERELARGDRTPGSARWQAERVHAGKEYDLRFHTDQEESAHIAQTILAHWQKCIGLR